ERDQDPSETLSRGWSDESKGSRMPRFQCDVNLDALQTAGEELVNDRRVMHIAHVSAYLYLASCVVASLSTAPESPCTPGWCPPAGPWCPVASCRVRRRRRAAPGTPGAAGLHRYRHQKGSGGSGWRPDDARWTRARHRGAVTATLSARRLASVPLRRGPSRR